MPIPSPLPFLTTLFSSLEPIAGTLDHLVLDHLCYRVDSVVRYEALKGQLLRENVLLVESLINGRRIATFRMVKPFEYGQRSIWLLELPEPKPGSHYPEGWEHAEFVTDRPLAEFTGWMEDNLGVAAGAIDRSGLSKLLNADVRLRLAGGLSVKFHELPLDRVIELELAAAKK